MIQQILFIVREYLYLTGTSFIILLAGFGIGLLVKKWSNKIFSELGLNKKLRYVGFSYNAQDILSSLLSYAVYAATILFLLREWGITSFILYIVVAGFLILIGLTLLVGIKDIVPDFISRFLIVRKNIVHIGKNISTREVHGKVLKIGLLETQIKSKRGDVLYVPNSFFMKAKYLKKS